MRRRCSSYARSGAGGMRSNTLVSGRVDRGSVVSDDSCPFWSQTLEDLLSSLNSSLDGLARAEAERRLVQHGPNALGADSSGRVIRLLLRQFGSPIVLLLMGAASL